MISRHYLVKGRVQGVGFRRFIHKRANELGVKGWVRNLGDGRVEALAQGPHDFVERLEVYLRRGPQSGQVEELTVKEAPSSEQLVDFEIKEDGEKPWEF